MESRELLSGISLNITPNTTAVAATYPQTADSAMPADITTASGVLTTLAVPGAHSTMVVGFFGNSIVGNYVDAKGSTHGFIYDGATYSTLDAPGSPWVTHIDGVSSNAIFGNDGTRAFVYNGTAFTTLQVPGASYTKINAVSGSTIYGEYDANGLRHGFVYNGSTYSTLEVPGGDYSRIQAVSGSNALGYFENATGGHNFFYNGSTIVTLDVPGAWSTQATGISGNIIVGSYKDSPDQIHEVPPQDGISLNLAYSTATANTHGFIYNGSTYTTIDVPGATNTNVTGISGTTIFGTYTDASGNAHDFTCYLYNGTKNFTSFDLAGSCVAESGMNILGNYVDQGEKGFLYQSNLAVPIVSSPSASGASDDAGQNSTGQNSTGQNSTGQNSTGQYSTCQYSTCQYSTGQYSTGQYSTGQYSTGQYSTGQYSTAQIIPALLLMHDNDSSSPSNSPDGATNGDGGPSQSIIPKVILGIDSQLSVGPAFGQNDKTYWQSPDQVMLMFPDSLDSTLSTPHV